MDGRPLLYGYNILLFMILVIALLYLHYFNTQDELYVRIKKLEQQVQSVKITVDKRYDTSMIDV